VNFFGLFRARRELQDTLRKLKPDLVHAGPVQKGAFLTSLVGFSPLVTMSWGSDLLLDAQSGIGRWLAKYTLRRSTVFLCDCETVANMAYELGMPKERTIIFPWGVDLAHYSPDGPSKIRKSLGWEDEIVLLSTRTMEAIYGVETIAEAFINLARKVKNVRLLLLGEGSLKEKIESRLHHVGLRENVQFAGQVGYENLPEYYRAADLYVSGSYVDGSSISLLEAMACGLPALVSDIPGNLEWVTPGLNGFIFRVGSHRALADRMIEATMDINILRSLGAQSRKVAEQRANWKLNSEKLLLAYELAHSVSSEVGSG
jgi:glycosyltransferase involved in cell wall biosynthesis